MDRGRGLLRLQPAELTLVSHPCLSICRPRRYTDGVMGSGATRRVWLLFGLVGGRSKFDPSGRSSCATSTSCSRAPTSSSTSRNRADARVSIGNITLSTETRKARLQGACWDLTATASHTSGMQADAVAAGTANPGASTPAKTSLVSSVLSGPGGGSHPSRVAPA